MKSRLAKTHRKWIYNSRLCGSVDESVAENPLEAINKELEKIKGPMQSIDEYTFFGKGIKQIYVVNCEATNQLVAQLSESQQKSLKEILRSQRITIETDKKESTVARKIIKLKRKPLP